MAKMNVYIPDALKRRMDEVEGVNWSPIACRAFETKLAELITQRGIKDMEDVVTRLRASRARTESRSLQEGRAKGRRWAMSSAEADWLERLAEYRRSRSDLEWMTMFDTESNWPLEIAYLIMTNADRSGVGAGDIFEFWQSALGDDFQKYKDDPSFIEGFLDGAFDVWDEVEDRL